MSGNFLPFGASIALAAIPVIVWLWLIRNRVEGSGLYIKTFILGTCTVIPPILLLLFFDKYPEYDIYKIITENITYLAALAFLTNAVVGIVEEIAKNIIVRVIDARHPEHVQTINSALLLSVCAGLGFAFIENILYFYQTWINPEFGARDLFATFIFRAIFTVSAHMIFSGIFGYYFGLGKFSADITDYERWQGKQMWFTGFLRKVTGKMSFEVVREEFNLKGLLIAMTMHAMYNASFDLDFKLPSILIVLFGAAYVIFLLNRKSGHLLFSAGRRRSSSMVQKDEDVVLELMGMWLSEGKYQDVVTICDRLLKRDPDNNVVKLFREKARDHQEIGDFYHALKNMSAKSSAEIVPSIKPKPDAQARKLSSRDEAVVLETMQEWTKSGNYNQVLQVAKRLLARNPESKGAQTLLANALGKQKLDNIVTSFGRLFGFEEGSGPAGKIIGHWKGIGE